MGFDLSILGVEKNIPKVDFKEYTGIFEAPEKFGKTAFAALYPNAIIVAAEEGYKAQVVNKISVHKWEDFIEFIDKLQKYRNEIKDSVQTIVIDTVDKLYPMAADYVCKKQSLKDKKHYAELKDIPYGQGWLYHDKEFETQINRIIRMGFCILYLTHSRVKTIKPKDGEPYDIYESTMPDRCAAIVYPACDYIIHGERRKVEVEEGRYELKRVLVVRGTDHAVAGNRVYFDEDIVFDTEEEAMEKFQQKFREGILRNLRKAGITESLEELEEKQRKEKEERVQKYLEEEKNDLEAKELKEKITEKLSKLNDNVKRDIVTPKFREILGRADFTKIDDAVKLKEALDFLNGLE